MNLINGLLGLAVLSSPLWLFLIVIPFTTWVVIKLAKHFKGVSARIGVSVGVFMLVFFTLFGDEIIGKLYFEHLCETEAGVDFYKAVELPAEYWDEQGNPKFLNSYGNPDHELWVKTIDRSIRTIESYSSVFSIDKDISVIKEKTTQKVLAKFTTFRYWGGWIRRNFSLNNTANSCKFMDDLNFRRDYYNNLFKPKKD